MFAGGGGGGRLKLIYFSIDVKVRCDFRVTMYIHICTYMYIYI